MPKGHSKVPNHNPGAGGNPARARSFQGVGYSPKQYWVFIPAGYGGYSIHAPHETTDNPLVADRWMREVAQGIAKKFNGTVERLPEPFWGVRITFPKIPSCVVMVHDKPLTLKQDDDED